MIDSCGLYVQADGSNGDSAHRTGLVCSLLALLGRRSEAEALGRLLIQNFQVLPGVYRRSPYGDLWDTHPRCFSRDQASRLILALALLGWKSEIRKWLRAMGRRGFFHQNNLDEKKLRFKFPDVMGLGEWSNVIRGLSWWWLYPLLVILDLNYLGMVFLRKPWDGVSLYVPDLKYALQKYWTPTAWLANRLNETTPWLEEALNNHSSRNNGCEELCGLFIALKELK
ncbi:hypothetical protein [Bdellovibrio sp. ArHS]|uniref:hypothetical protein n=1 Tax=Bdellovibrio sp. ArHS TaxID=1569284 RepID=UPI0025C461BB|nr:hypothetical protein [Bdellovibrio sp. ArHS]